MFDGASCYRRFLDGDQAAFSELIREYRSPVTFFIQRYVQDICAAEDIAADVFMELIVHPERYRFEDSLRTYLFVLARSRALDYLRQQKRHSAVPLEDAAEQLADTQDLEREVLRAEQARMVHEAIGQLPNDQQIAVHLVYFEQYTYAETARIMRKTRKQVDNLLYRAKKALRGIIGEEAAQRI